MELQRIENVVKWKKFGELEHFRYSILHIDAAQQRAELLFKLEPHKPIILHRHGSLNKLLVLSGEHHIYEADGTLSEIRTAGTYTVAEASDKPHSECGGDDGAIVLFSIFDNGGKALYELMNESLEVIATLTMNDLVELNSCAN